MFLCQTQQDILHWLPFAFLLLHRRPFAIQRQELLTLKQTEVQKQEVLRLFQCQLESRACRDEALP